jgi:hypothetical protein
VRPGLLHKGSAENKARLRELTSFLRTGNDKMKTVSVSGL